MRLDDKKRPRTCGAPTEILACPRNVWSGTLRLETDRNRVRPSARTVGARDEDTHFRIILGDILLLEFVLASKKISDLAIISYLHFPVEGMHA